MLAAQRRAAIDSADSIPSPPANQLHQAEAPFKCLAKNARVLFHISSENT